MSSRKAAVRSGNGDIDAFTLMVKANEEEGSKYRLDESELVRLYVLPLPDPGLRLRCDLDWKRLRSTFRWPR